MAPGISTTADWAICVQERRDLGIRSSYLTTVIIALHLQVHSLPRTLTLGLSTEEVLRCYLDIRISKRSLWVFKVADSPAIRGRLVGVEEVGHLFIQVVFLALMSATSVVQMIIYVGTRP